MMMTSPIAAPGAMPVDESMSGHTSVADNPQMGESNGTLVGRHHALALTPPDEVAPAQHKRIVRYVATDTGQIFAYTLPADITAPLEWRLGDKRVRLLAHDQHADVATNARNCAMVVSCMELAGQHFTVPLFVARGLLEGLQMLQAKADRVAAGAIG